MSGGRHDGLGQRNAGIEGRVAITVTAAAGRVAAVSIASTRPLGAAAVLENREVTEAICSLRLLYSLCGTAHTVAGLEAAEAALGRPAGDTAAAARRILVAGESLGQILWRVLLDLPQSAGEDTAFSALRDARARLARLAKSLYPGSDWIRLGGAGAAPDGDKLAALADALDEIVGLGVFGEDADVAAILADPDRFADWAARGETPIARVLRTIAARGWAGFGAGTVAPLPALDADRVAARLAAADGRGFAAAPDLDGRVFETGALARHRRQPLIAALIAGHGAGLTARIAAKLVAIVDLIGVIRDGCRAPRQGGQRAGAGGLATVETARGRLVHYVEIADGRTARYRILAPTEWNFHARGPLAEGLTGCAIGEIDDFRQAASLLVTAIDPCVQFDLDMA